MTLLALSFPFSFEEPTWLWLALLVPVLIPASLRSLAGLDPVRRVFSLITRSVLIILLAACLAGVEHVKRNRDLTVMVLMDRSHSVQVLEDVQEEYLREISKDIPPNDKLGVISFARNAYLEQLPMRGGYHIPPDRLSQIPDIDRSDIASAMRLAMAMFPHDTAKRVLLLTDGNDNMGDVLTEARRAKADGIPVDVVPLWYEHKNEIYIDRLLAPTYAEEGEQVPLRMVINSERRASGTLSLYHNGEQVPMAPEDAHVELQPGGNTFFSKLTARSTGDQRYEVYFRPDDETMDAVSINNKASAFSFVQTSSNVLLVTMDKLFDLPLARALESENIRVDVKTVDELEQFDLLRMMSYSTIVLANIPANVFTDQQHEQLARYVKDTGSGLIMLGGNEAFGAGGWIGTPIEDVMPVSFEIKHKRVIPRGALVLIMHSCEVPRGNYYGKEMAKKSVDTISSRDYIGVLAYSFSPGGNTWEVPFALNTNKAAVKSSIDRMQIGDMPDFASTMRMAYKELTSGKGKDAAQKHVIILSDGDAAPPPPGLLDDYKKAKITVSTIAIGWGGHVMTRTMQDIAKKTGGKFYAARSPRALPQIFVKESKIVRRPLIVDEPFQPQIVQAANELLSGLDYNEQVPRLGGMVLTSPKPNPNVQMPIVRATKDGNDPVLAHWQCELGKTVAFTSGYWPRWGEHWTVWPKFAKFWAQVVRWTMRQEAPANFDVYSKIDGDRGRIVVDALDKDASFLNFLQLQTRLVGPDNRTAPLQFYQTGPGHYEAEFPVEKAGEYLATVQVYESGRSRGTIRTGLTVPFSPEYRELGINEALLRRIQEITGGRWLELAEGPREHDVFRHDLPPAEAKKPVWDWMLAWLILPLFLFDVSVRRLASWLALSIVVEALLIVVLLVGFEMRFTWWGVLGVFVLAELIGWTMRWRYIGPLFDYLTHTVTALATAGERSRTALEQLKHTRERLREDLEEQRAEALRRLADSADAQVPEIDRTRRFDVGDQRAKEEVGDLTEALGGARTGETYKEKRRAPAPATKDEGEGESATERLLKAKRRAQRDMKKED
jgi:uncharacterized membrane protein